MPQTFEESSVPEQSGRTVFLTGANTGIGFETARVLAARGARVLIGCRSSDKATQARRRILQRHPDAQVETVRLDLADLASVRDAAATVAQQPRLDLLINNAGIMMPPRSLTVDGFESQFGVNHLGHFALTGLLLPVIRRQRDARIVTVSSLAHRSAVIDWDDLQAERAWHPQARYGMSKLANLLFAYELQRRLQTCGSSVMSVACHPGIAQTELARHLPWGITLLMPLVRLFFNSQAAGALPTLMAATASDIQGGDYCGPRGRGEMAGPAVKVRSSARSHDQEQAARLWDLSVELTGVDPFEGDG